MIVTHSPDPFRVRGVGHRGRLIHWEGHQLLELESPELRLAVSLTRGAEITQLYDKRTDTELLWRGHEDIYRNRVAPVSIGLDEGNFLDHFSGGWQTVLPNAQYRAEVSGASLGAHGEAALLPWDFRVTRDDGDALAVELWVRLRRVPVLLTRTLRLQRATVRMDDCIENLSVVPLPYQWGHHVALAGAALPAGCELLLPTGTSVTVPTQVGRGYRYAAGSHSWPDVVSPAGEPLDASRLPDDDGTQGHLICGPMSDGSIALVVPGGPRLQFDWDVEAFPYCWIWQVFGGQPEWPLWGRHRLVTVEPFSSPVERLDDQVTEGTATTLDGRSQRTSWVQLAVGGPPDAAATSPKDQM